MTSVVVTHTSDDGGRYTLASDGERMVLSHPTGIIFLAWYDVERLRGFVPTEVLLSLSTKLEEQHAAPLVLCANRKCRAEYTREAFELLEQHRAVSPFDRTIAVRVCAKCGACVAAPRA